MILLEEILCGQKKSAGDQINENCTSFDLDSYIEGYLQFTLDHPIHEHQAEKCKSYPPIIVSFRNGLAPAVLE